MPDHRSCEERARRLTELKRRLTWERLQKARLLDDVDLLRRHNVDLQVRLEELEDALFGSDEEPGEGFEAGDEES